MHTKQRTIARAISMSGVGLHTGKRCKLTFKPAPINSGVHFVRTDLDGAPRIKAD
ncbi:MAG TPA: UDP-3-O-acyl-N-acetylglucosamine deacetylase, partial [candidate division Zixibacteria bacterium]|nr:UDP-3-O-acyl-N-acetylglucosamine deacetylase [candidate division Zixibacteria bacterium]